MGPTENSTRLTTRQHEVASLVAGGLTNRDVADELGISVDGVKYHVSEILGRLGLSLREGIRAALWSYRGSSAMPLRSTSRGRARETEFAGRMLDVARSGMLQRLIGLGVRTGLLATMSDLSPAPADVIAAEAKLDERYVLELLSGLAVGRIVEYDPATRSFELPREHAAVLGAGTGGGFASVFGRPGCG